MIVKKTFKYGLYYGAFTGLVWMPIIALLNVFYAVITSTSFPPLALGNIIYSPMFAIGGLFLGGIFGVIYGLVLYVLQAVFGFDYVAICRQLIRASILVIIITSFITVAGGVEVWLSSLLTSIIFFWIPETGFILMNHRLIRVLQPTKQKNV